MQKRLNKFISDTGLCSRRQADELIAQGKVRVNGQKAAIGTKVQPEDKIYVSGQLLTQAQNLVYIAFNKPVGVTSTTDLKDKSNIIDFINYPKRIFPIGRLDKDSEGLILLTNDGDIVNKILRAANKHEKEYLVWVDRSIDSNFIQKMRSGIDILGTRTQKCDVFQLGPQKFKIILTQGLNRQIRRMCEKLDYVVTKLKRTRIMHIHLRDLKSGTWRYLTTTESSILNELIRHSSNI